jgi:hypothetical protein
MLPDGGTHPTHAVPVGAAAHGHPKRGSRGEFTEENRDFRLLIGKDLGSNIF